VETSLPVGSQLRPKLNALSPGFGRSWKPLESGPAVLLPRGLAPERRDELSITLVSLPVSTPESYFETTHGESYSIVHRLKRLAGVVTSRDGSGAGSLSTTAGFGTGASSTMSPRVSSLSSTRMGTHDRRANCCVKRTRSSHPRRSPLGRRAAYAARWASSSCRSTRVES